MSLELIVLGCSGSGPAPATPASGYLVRSSTTALWVDAGTGTFMELGKYLDPADLDAVSISHLHADHSVDFLGFFHYVAYRTPPAQPIPVFLPPGSVAKFSAYVDAGPDHALFRVFSFEELGEPAVRSVGNLTLRFAPADHSAPTNALRVESDGRALVYSGDTGPAGGFPELAAGADVMLCEAGLSTVEPDATFSHHLSAGQAGRIAAAGGVGRLILTHLAPTLSSRDVRAAAAAEYSGPIDVATPGMRVAV